MSRQIQLASVILISALVLLSCDLPSFSIGSATSTPTAAPLPPGATTAGISTATRSAVTPTALLPTATRSTAATAVPKATLTRAAATATQSSGGGQAGYTMSTFEDPEGFYTLQVPQNWVQRKSGSQLQFCSTSEAKVCIAVSLRIKAIDPGELIQESIALYAERTSGFKEGAWEFVEIDGYPGAWANISYTLDGQKRDGAIVAAVRNRIGFQLEFWTPSGEFGLFGPLFEQMVAEMKITQFKDAPDYEQWEVFESDSLIFYYLKDTWAGNNIAAIAAEHEKAFTAIQKAIGTVFFSRPEIYLYSSTQSLYHSTYRDSGFAIDVAEEVHSMWISENDHQTPGHELTHVVMYQELGPASQALLGEGIAVCLDQSGRDYRQVGRDLAAQGKLVPLRNLLGDNWFKVDPAVAYAQSGSFVCYLLKQYGMMGVSALYMSNDFERALDAAVGNGATVDSIEKEWKDWLGK